MWSGQFDLYNGLLLYQFTPLLLCCSSEAVHFQKNGKKRFNPAEHTVSVLQRSPQRLSVAESWGGGTSQNDPGSVHCIVDNEN